MEMVRVVSHNMHKRMVSCLQGHIGTDGEKRHVRDLCAPTQIAPSLHIHSNTLYDTAAVTVCSASTVSH